MNTMWFCGEPLDSRKEISLPKSRIESLEPIEYRFVPSTDLNTVVEVIYGSQRSPSKPLPMAMKGCQLTTDKGAIYQYEFTCNELKKVIKAQ